MASNLNLSNTSYTNKEFNDIYPELLEKAKDLSYKWDPTVSNESDPGVTLIKEIALALDKINYSADKNALETMPLSVTQERTARQLFQLLGYYPKWYISAEATVSLAWKTDQDAEDYVEGGVVKVPAFTQIRDDSGDYVYTIPIDTPLRSDGTVEKVTAIQGVVKPLKINNSTLITLDLLDANNRVYFPDYNVAQNGVFILSKDAQESKEINERTFWEQKDNLYVEEVGNYFYSFNVDISTNRCYIEFPADISELIGGGVYVYYLVSAGKDGVVGIGQLNQLYDSTITAQYIQGGTDSVTLDSSNLRIQNIDLLVSGKDPESINSMYQNYNHIKGTFDTLVTLRDYNNAVYNTGEVSNAVVCDRTNDVQQAYRIVASTLNDSENIVYRQESDYSEHPYEDGKIDPFGLKIYALQYNDLTNTTSTSQNKQAYDNTFQMYADLDVEDPLNVDSSLRQLVLLLNDERCIQHDFSDIEPNKICLIKNVAEINLMVFPTVRLTDSQKDDVVNSIRNQIYDKYNARMVNFGEEINYDDLFTNIITSSNLIKNISLGQIQYFAYALYYSNDEYDGDYKLAPAWKEVCVSDEVNYLMCNIEDDYVLSGNRLAHHAVLAGTTSNVTSKNVKNIFLMTPDGEQGGGNVYFLNQDNDVVLYSTKRNEFRNEILVKNILAGITPLFQTDSNAFIYGADETDEQVDSAQTFDIVTEMPFEFEQTTQARYYPKNNEVIQFVRPQLSSAMSYSSYVKYDYVGQEVRANADHTLTADETLVLYYKTEDSESAPYTRVIYGSYKNQKFKPAIISPSFKLTSTTRQIQILQDPAQVPSTTLTIKSGQQIQIKQKNEVVLNSATNYIYVIGDESVDENGIQQYRLKLTKESRSSEDFDGYYYYSTVLQTSQQLIYASDQLSYLNIVGSGTKVTIKTTNGDKDYIEIVNRVVSIRSIQRYGVSALDGKWQKISDEITLLAQEFINVQGTVENTATESDAWVEISSPVSLSSTVLLNRDGLSYQAGSPISSGIAVGNIQYVDDFENSRIEEVTLQTNVVPDFVTNSSMYDDQRESFVDQIQVSTTAYRTQQIDGIYENGIGPLSIVGQRSSSWTLNGEQAHYIISGASLYLVTETTNKVFKIEGYPSNVPSDNVSITKEQQIGQYNYTSSTQLPVGKSLMVLCPTGSIEKQFYRVVQSNHEDVPIDISFSSQQDLTFGSGTGEYVAKIVDSYYTIDSIIFDYNTEGSGASSYMTPVGSPVASNASNNDNGIPKQFITIQAHEVVSDQRITFALTQATNAYQYNNASGSAVIMPREWQFTNSHGDTCFINDTEFRSKVFDYYGITLTNRTINKWVWNIQDFDLNIIAVRDMGSLSPQVYSITYKNKGGEEESIQLSDEPNSGWTMYGLAYIDSTATKPTKVFDNQTLTINDEQVTTDSDEVSYVYSSIPIYAEGYRELNLKYINEKGEEEYPKMLVTKLPADVQPYKQDIGTKTITIEDECGQKSGDEWSDMLVLKFVPPKEQNYILEIKNFFDLEEFHLEVEHYNYEVLCLNKSYDSSITEEVGEQPNSYKRKIDTYSFEDKGTYYFHIKKALSSQDREESNHILFCFGIKKKVLNNPLTGLTNSQYELVETRGQVKVQLGSIRSLDYSSESFVNTGNVDQIVDSVKQRSIYNGVDIFNYFYQPQKDKMILNPLKGESFNNHNHFYNPYTICKVQTYDLLGDSNIFINM